MGTATSYLRSIGNDGEVHPDGRKVLTRAVDLRLFAAPKSERVPRRLRLLDEA